MPNAAAQQLRKNTRSSVAVITASTSNHYYLDLMRGLRGAIEAGRLADHVAVFRRSRMLESQVR